MGVSRIIAVDPGKNTGVAIIERDDAGNLALNFWSAPAFVAVNRVHAMMTHYPITVVACERFTVTSVKHTRQYNALEVIGALRYVTGIYVCKFELQSRADRLRVTSEILRRLTSDKFDDDDQKSALQHAVLAAVRHRVILDPKFLVGS